MLYLCHQGICIKLLMKIHDVNFTSVIGFLRGRTVIARRWNFFNVLVYYRTLNLFQHLEIDNCLCIDREWVGGWKLIANVSWLWSSDWCNHIPELRAVLQAQNRDCVVRYLNQKMCLSDMKLEGRYNATMWLLTRGVWCIMEWKNHLPNRSQSWSWVIPRLK